MQRFIFKIAAEDAWAEAEAQGRFTGSADDERDGFIHFSSAAQVARTLDKHFASREGLVLACIDTTALAGDLKWEGPQGGDAFPHLYADLPMQAVTEVMPLPVHATGAQAAALAGAMVAAAGGGDAA